MSLIAPPSSHKLADLKPMHQRTKLNKLWNLGLKKTFSPILFHEYRREQTKTWEISEKTWEFFQKMSEIF